MSAQYIYYLVRKAGFFCLAIGIALNLQGQSDPVSSHHHINSFLVNPAASGAHGGIGITAGYRYQWTGIDGAPQTTYIYSDALLPAASSGVGFGIVFDKAGAYTFTRIQAAYAYIIEAGRWKLSEGINAGLTLQGLNGSKLVTPDGDYSGGAPDHQDDILPTDKYKSVRPDLGVGFMASLPGTVEVGIAVQNLINTGTSIEGVSGSSDVIWGRTFYVHAKADIGVGENFSIVPSLLFRTDFNNFQADLLALIGFKDFLYAGLGYRGYNKNSSGSLIPTIGFKPLKKMQVYYSYDAGVGALSNFSSGSHEIAIKYVFPVKENDKKPKILYNPRFL